MCSQLAFSHPNFGPQGQVQTLKLHSNKMGGYTAVPNYAVILHKREKSRMEMEFTVVFFLQTICCQVMEKLSDLDFGKKGFA